ncbi:MAG: hypothetical protein Ct9H300mP15_21410 [Gemmatimonadota bacterium]|nr:MAG: hypothetical protein Ct9H300mP15_21410 [Gemmatimonadota bacterium]
MAELKCGAFGFMATFSGAVTGGTRAILSPGETYVPPAWLAGSNGVLFAGTGVVAAVFFGLFYGDSVRLLSVIGGSVKNVLSR